MVKARKEVKNTGREKSLAVATPGESIEHGNNVTFHCAFSTA